MVLARSSNLILRGIAASPGIAIGRARLADRVRVSVTEGRIATSHVDTEVRRFFTAIDDVREDLQNLKRQLEQEKGADHLFVLDAHLLILDDAMLAGETVECIKKEFINAEAALKRSLNKFRAYFETIGDEYLRERCNDVEVVGERILRRMTGALQESINDFEGRAIIVTHDLSPADVLQIDKSRIIGFATDLGGKTSHTSILARALEIPAVVGLETATSVIMTGDHFIIDGTAGTVIVNPDDETFRDYLSRKQYYEYRDRELAKLKTLPSMTLDGHRVSLKGNLEFIEELSSLSSHGGEGVGLYRTEMLFMNRSDLPDEEEQFAAYSQMAKMVSPWPVSIRTLDVGGDKFVPDLNLGDELNPALGLRAIRLSLRNPEILRPQLRAILRASAFGDVRLFFPMISGVGEIRAVKKIMEELQAELRSKHIPFDEKIKIGIMIEVPSVVLIADLLAREVDFFSVGTNDLIQYTLAIDRTNEHLSHLYEPLNPAILRSLKLVVDAAHEAGIDACICGEMAGDPLYLPILLGLGFDELSMSPPSIPRVKNILRRCSLAEAQHLVASLLTLSTAAEIESYLKSEIAAHFSDSID
jgi:phosphotransferase system enzyme I (PtsI)